MRWIALFLALIAGVAVVLSILTDGGAAELEVAAAMPSAIPLAQSPEREVDASRAPAELEREADEPSPPARTEAAPPSTRLEIRIVDDAGRAREGIRLTLLSRKERFLFGRIGAQGEDRHPWIRTTGPDGLAIWDGLDPNEDCRWAAYEALVDYEPAPIGEETFLSGSFALPAGETTRLTGRLVPTLTVVGRVQDRDSKPRSGVRVTALRRDDHSRSVIMSATTDAEGRFTLRRVRRVPLRLECVVTDAPDLLTLVTRDVVPGGDAVHDAGVLKLDGRTLRVTLRAIDAGGLDVTHLAAIEGGRAVPVQVEGCFDYPQHARIPLGGSFRLIGFDCPSLRIRIPQDPPLESCAPGWAIDWRASALEISAGMEGELRLEVLATPAQETAFSATPIHRAGVPDQRGVALLKVSLQSKHDPARIDFEMRALLGVSFDGVQAIPPGEYRLEAICEDEGALWTASRDVVVSRDAGEPVRIELVRAR